MRRLVVVVLLLALPELVWAEKLRGKVIDGTTLQPVAGARVRTLDGEATTNSRGIFEVESRVDRVTVQVEATGYLPGSEDVVVKDGGLDDLLLVLFDVSSSSETIEIRGYKRPPVRKPPGKLEITREELTRIPGTRGDALQSIRSLPGVADSPAAGAGPGQIVIRGSAPEDSKITIDGIEVPLLYHFFGVQSILPSEFIEEIEYSPGGFGPEEGRSTGGVINVRSRVTKGDEIEGFTEVSFINLAGLVTGPLSKKHDLYFAAALRRSLIDFVLPLAIPDDVNLSFTAAPVYYDSQLRVDWTPRYSDRVTFFGFMSSDELSLLNDEITPNEPLATGNFDNSTGFWRGIVSWKHETDELESTLVASGGLTSVHFGIGEERYFDVEAWSMQNRADVVWKPSKTAELRAGVESILLRGEQRVKLPLPPGEGTGGVFNFSSAPVLELEGTQRNHASGAYMAADFHPFAKTTISPGLRLDYFHRYQAAAWGPRLAIQHRVRDPLTLRFSMGSYSRAAQQNEAITTSLGPELATQYVLGGEYQVRQGVVATSNLFYTDRRALIVQDPVVARAMPEDSYVNLGQGRSFGAELVIRAQLDDFFGWLAYTVSRSDRIDTPLADRRLFDFDQTHIVTLLGSYKLGAWQLGGRWQFSTGRPLTPIEGARYLSDLNIYVPTLGALNSDRFDPAHQLDVRIDRKFHFDHWKLEVYLDVTNVYAHPRVLGYRYNYDFSQEEAVTELPVVPALGVRGSF